MKPGKQQERKGGGLMGRVEPWYHSATLYHIYPLSFADSNGDGFGDLPGILAHLDYLNDGTADSLGVGAIWLSPVYVSPMADWGYDVADHMAIDPRFGTMADFERLLAAVHERGMKLLMDFVPNHTSDAHAWFMEARSDRASDKRDWYIWADPKEDGGPPNNWLSHFGGSAWTLDRKTGQYYLHSYLPQQPDLNWRNPAVREAMLEVLRFWLAKGVDGFRTDAVYGLIKDELLRDDPPNMKYRPGVSNPSHEFLRVHSAGQSELGEVIGSFCDVLAEHSDRTFLLSEAYLNIPGLQQLYKACERHPVHAPFNFNLMTLAWGADSFRQFIDAYEAAMGPDDWPNYVLGNHDRHRLASRVGARRAKLLSLLQLTLRGLPVVYYGDELGMVDGIVRLEQVRDPRAQRMPGFGLGRDSARTPMGWTPDNDGGFTTGRPWLPMGAQAYRHNVEVEDRQPDSMLNMYRHLIHLRSSCPALTVGDYRAIKTGHEDVFGYVRETELQRMLVVLNFGKEPAKVTLHGPVGAWVAGTHDVQGDGLVPAVDGAEGASTQATAEAVRLAAPGSGRALATTISLEPYEGRVYELRQEAH